MLALIYYILGVNTLPMVTHGAIQILPLDSGGMHPPTAKCDRTLKSTHPNTHSPHYDEFQVGERPLASSALSCEPVALPADRRALTLA